MKVGSPTAQVISPDLVRSEVNRFWAAFISKDADALEQFYAHESVGFGSTSSRTEPGRLAAIRRRREYFGASGDIRAQLGLVDVVIVGDTVAVAAYTFTFRANRTLANGSSETENIANGRATQVFGFDAEGRLRIFHEHFSVPV